MLEKDQSELGVSVKGEPGWLQSHRTETSLIASEKVLV